MTLKSLNAKKICVLGLGIENAALVEFLLKKKIICEITVCDSRNNKELEMRCKKLYRQKKQLRWKLGKGYDRGLNNYDIIFRIAGYPLFSKKIIKAMLAGVEISSAAKFFFDLCPTKNIIGVTGTKGKGTTASLIYKILKDAGKRAFLAGNIGTAMFSIFDKIKKDDWVVLELSSFQLEDLHKSPRIAVFTNFFEEHLAPADPFNPNHHKTLQTYWHAKENIFAHQKRNGFLVINSSLKDKFGIHKPKSKIIYFTASNLKTSLIGEHNRKNIAAAVLAADRAGIKKTAIAKSVKNFRGLEHRLEFVQTINNTRYYNDTFATTPEATITALSGFAAKKIILIAGGSDKGSDFRKLAKEIKKRALHLVLLPGKGSKKIKRDLKKIKYKKITEVKSMKQAVKAAQKIAVKGNVVLLSPACASFSIFKNYKERGNLFKKEIKK